MLNVCLEIKSSMLGSLEILSPFKKGGVEEYVLLWDSGEAGKGVSINKGKEEIMGTLSLIKAFN